MGNLHSESRNGLEFSYNLANLPESVEGADGASLTYSYLSGGRLSGWDEGVSEGETFVYDRRGNLLSVTQRYAEGGGTPQTETYSYSSERLSGYTPRGASSPVSFTHDALGRMTADGSAGTQISYNCQDLPSVITKGDGSTTLFDYLVDGTKLSVTDGMGAGLVYRGPFIYRVGAGGLGRTLESVPYEGGRLTPDGVFRYMTDHLGSIRAVVGSDGETLALNEFGPYGSRKDLPGADALITSPADSVLSLRYRFTGKEDLDPDFSVPYTDFGARLYSPALRRWMAPDKLSEKYYDINPYVYCAGNPVNLVDLNGMDVYILLYTTDNSRGDEMFKASAETRKRDIENSSSFDSKNDIVILVGIQDMAAISSTVSSIVEAYSGDYGKTKEFSVWSHGGKDGPVGSIATSDFSLDTKQMTLEGWSNIDFNWGKNSTANFFGCNTGNGSPSFTTNVSNLENFENVTVNGQQSSSYPSIFTDTRTNNSSIINGSFSYPTYMVGSKRGGIIGHFSPSSTPAVPMSSSLNGIELNKKYYQNGRKH